ncbi:MAG: hypothetical protein JWQ11_2196 [Rhizobacter sp.]|nr:hypothetical protein [Rhizobacter sp.]
MNIFNILGQQSATPRSAAWRNAALAAVVVTLAACASKGIAPVEQLSNARASIAQAEGAGAATTAPVELLSSRDKLTRAEAAVRDEKFDMARGLAEESQADAQLAERKARTAKAQAAAAELVRSNQQLGQEAQRNATKP